MREINDSIVLVVEDDELNATLMKKMLEIAGVKYVVVSTTGDEARAQIRALPHVDVVLLDLRMPGEDGFEILPSLRALLGEKETRVVAATANVMPEDVAQAEAAGFDGFLGKPFNLDRFKGQISRILSGERVWEPR